MLVQDGLEILATVPIPSKARIIQKYFPETCNGVP